MNNNDKVQEILLRKNLPHVATIMNKHGDIEELDFDSPLNIIELTQGVAELNKNGIMVPSIKAGVSKEGVTKIANLNSLGTETYDADLPEVNFIPFKSDSWILGDFIVQYKTGKGIPKKFLKSQLLLDKFSDNVLLNDEIDLKKLLVLDPSQRSYTWDLVPKSDGGGCSVM